MQFGEFAGNAAAKQQLGAMMDAGHFPHALLFEGEPGTGRRTLATCAARAAVCRAHTPAQRPCGVCAACQKPVHPDILCFGGDGATLSVDTIRQLREEAYVLPNESAVRVMLLVEAHTMTPQAQNALLKILEEPPAHVLFMLTCDNRSQLLPTIVSRCVCIPVSPVEWEQAAPVLRRLLPQTEESLLQQAHGLFGGCIGRVVEGLQEGLWQQILELVPLFAAALLAPTEWPLLQLTARLEKNRPLTDGVLAGLQLVLRDALVLQYNGARLLSTAPNEARDLAARLTGRQLTALLEQTKQLQQAQAHNMNNTLFLVRLCACLRQAAGH